MEVKLQLGVFLLLVHGSLAVWKQVTVMKGESVRLKCLISGADRSPVEWKNPDGFLMFFNHRKALKDKRYSITRLSQSVFSISIANVTFRDGGNYTCTHFGHAPTQKKVELTVIGFPQISVTKQEGKHSIKCSASASASPPPALSWKLDDGAEFSVAATHFQQEKKKFVSESIINLRQLQGRVTVHCLLHHPALNSQPLRNFVKVGRNAQPSGPASSSSSTSAPPPSSSSAPPPSSTSAPPPSSTSTPPPSSTSAPPPSSTSTPPPSSTSAPPPSSTSTPPPSSTSAPPPSSTGGPAVGGETGPPSSDPASTQPHPPTPPSPEHLSTQGWASASETTEYITSSNSTKGNHTGSFSSDLQVGVQRNSTLLVLLVTCLIAGLLVVLLFLAVKLRKAHAAWRRENEDSDPSEDSSKSKTSQEEKQVQRRRGLYNTTFAQYVVQEPTVMVPEVDAAAQTVTDRRNLQLSSRPEPEPQISSRPLAKETSL